MDHPKFSVTTRSTKQTFSNSDSSSELELKSSSRQIRHLNSTSDKRVANSQHPLSCNTQKKIILNYSSSTSPENSSSFEDCRTSTLLINSTEYSCEESETTKALTTENWVSIKQDLSKNSTSITSLKIKFSLDKNQLSELLESLNKNTELGYISWHKSQINSRELSNLIKKIEAKLIENNKNYRYHPSDFVHGLLSKHVYNNESIEGTSITLNPIFDVHLKDWQIKKIFHDKKSGYHAAIYINHQTHQIVLSIRGLKKNMGILKDLVKDKSSLKANFEEIIAHQLVIGQQARNYQATAELVQIAKELNYQPSFTGYSLGAWLAELSVYYCHAYFQCPNATAITFESPGSQPMMKMLQSNLINSTSRVDLNDLNIITYLANPNPANCCNPHVGTIFKITPQMKKTDACDKKLPKVIKNTLGDAINGFLSIEGHGLSKILATFDPITGRPKEYSEMADWPTMKYRGTKSFSTAATALLEQGINEAVNNGPFGFKKIAVPATACIQKATHWLIGDKTLMTLVGFIKSLVCGDIDQEQYWEYFKHISFQELDKDLSEKNTIKYFNHKFGLIAEAKYRETPRDCLNFRLHTNPTTDFLYELCQVSKFLNSRTDLPEIIKIQLKEILHCFTLKNLGNYQFSLIPKENCPLTKIKDAIEYTKRLRDVIPSYILTQAKQVPSPSSTSVSSHSNSKSFPEQEIPFKQDAKINKKPESPQSLKIAPSIVPQPSIINENLKLFVISLQDLKNQLFHNTLNLQHSQNTCLSINTIHEVIEFKILLTSQPDAKFYSVINELSLRAIKIKKDNLDAINELFSIISENKLFSNSCTALSINDIANKIKIKLPTNFKKLIIKNIQIINNFDDLSCLTSLLIENIDKFTSFTLPNSLKNLKDLDILKIGLKVTLKLDTLHKLSKLKLENIERFTNIQLPICLQTTLTELTLQNISSKTTIKFPTTLENLSSLSLGKKIPINLPSTPRLTTIKLQDALSLSIVKDLNSIIDLHMSSITSSFILPPSLKNISNLYVSEICEYASLELKTPFEKLSLIHITSIKSNAQLILSHPLPISLVKNQKLIFTNIDPNALDLQFNYAASQYQREIIKIWNIAKGVEKSSTDTKVL